MEPQEIDKLFGERLNNHTPSPPADLWNRLQERIETEMPAPQIEEKPVLVLWPGSYGIAAAITVLLTVGIAFFNLRNDLPANDNLIAQTEAFRTEHSDQAITQAPAGTAAAGDTKTPEAPEKTAAPATKPTAPASTLAQAAPQPAESRKPQETGVKTVKLTPVQTLAASTPTLETPTPGLEGIVPQPVTPVPVFASAPTDQDVQPVEIIIKRSSAPQVAAGSAEEEEEELTGFEKKHRLAKGIFRQARNLTNGDRVDLSDLGINANKIALETQIGKQKFSKVINL